MHSDSVNLSFGDEIKLLRRYVGSFILEPELFVNDKGGISTEELPNSFANLMFLAYRHLRVFVRSMFVCISMFDLSLVFG